MVDGLEIFFTRLFSNSAEAACAPWPQARVWRDPAPGVRSGGLAQEASYSGSSVAGPAPAAGAARGPPRGATWWPEARQRRLRGAGRAVLPGDEAEGCPCGYKPGADGPPFNSCLSGAGLRRASWARPGKLGEPSLQAACPARGRAPLRTCSTFEKWEFI